MKHLSSLFISMIFSALLNITTAQAPQGMNYQAIARDAGGAVLSNKNISVRFTITNGNGGFTLYKETHQTTTNQLGLFTLTVGYGTPDTASFSSIDWAAYTPWMQVELDPNGGSNFTVMGSTQLLSVPYALFAQSSNTGQTSATVGGTSTLTITSADTTIPLKVVPGLTQTINVSAGYKTLITTNGGIQTTSSVAAGFSGVDILIFIDGFYAGSGCYRRVYVANNTGLSGMMASWSLTKAITLPEGSHTIDVRALYAQGSSAKVSGDSNSVLQGSLTVTTIKN